jgi:alkylation response protein AidB-like acyl-CoA dehydrogenase
MADRAPGPEASMRKFLSDVHGQHLTELAADLCGPAGALAGDDATGPLGAEAGEWPWAFLFARALTIGGGTAQVQRNILAERVLGLPRDRDDTAGVPWREAQRRDVRQTRP